MKHTIANMITAASLCVFAAAALGQPERKDGSNATSSIRAANQEFMASLAKGDAAALAGMYTNDAQVMPANAEVIRGREGIQKYWQGAIDSGIKGLKLETLEVHGGANSDTAAEVGKYSVTAGGEKVIEVGKFIVIWKREDGKWRLHRDMFSSDRPTPASPISAKP